MNEFGRALEVLQEVLKRCSLKVKHVDQLVLLSVDVLVDLKLSLIFLKLEEGLLQEHTHTIAPQQYLHSHFVITLAHLVYELQDEVYGFLMLG